MSKIKLTAGMQQALAVLSRAPGGADTVVNLRACCGLTIAGWRRVATRLEAASYVERPAYNGLPRWQITDAGRAAIAKAEGR